MGLNRNKLLVALVVILFAIYWQWWLPGPRVASDFPFVSNDSLKSFFDLPRVWLEYGGDGLGNYSVYTLWSYPLNLIFSIISKLGITFAILERILIIIPFLLLGVFSIWKFLESFNLSKLAKFISSLFYLTNSYIILVIDGGQLNIALAYAIFPLNFYLFEKSLEGNLKSKILAAISIWILGSFDFRFIFVLAVVIFIRFVYELIFLKIKEWKEWTFAHVKIFLIIAFVLTTLNAYWLIPLLFVPISQDTFQNLTQTSFSTLFNIGHSMSLLSPHWSKNVFGQITPLKFEFLLIPILVFLAPVLRAKNKEIGFWLTLSLISIFLSKGFSEPLSQIYQWLYQNIPGFSLFRDSTKFFFLVALSFTMLLSITVDEIMNRLKDSRMKILFPIGLLIYLLLLVRPAWLGQMTGTFSIPLYQKEYSTLQTLIKQDQEFSRIFWIPSIPPLGLLSQNHPSVEAARFAQMRPFAIGVEGAYEFFNFLREASFTGELFDVAGIGYIAYPPLDPRRDDLHPDNIKYYYTFSDQLSELPWLSRVEASSILLWKTARSQDKFFVASNIWFVLGSDSIYKEAIKSSTLHLSNNALVFAEESPGIINKINEVSSAKILLNNKTTVDLAASLIPASQLIFPAEKLKYDPDLSGWWKRDKKDLIGFRYFLKTKYGIDNKEFDLGGGWAVGEDNLELEISGKWEKDDLLLARIYESSRSGQLKFYQNGNLVGQINTLKEGNNVRWVEVGKLLANTPITVSSNGDINIVNAFAFVDQNQWSVYYKKAMNLNKVTDFSDVKQSQDVEVKYQKINSTKYKVWVKGLKNEGFLIFSQSFDPSWKLGSTYSIPVYSLLNGFHIGKDGEYIVEFEPQKYVYPGFIISVITLVILIFLLTKSSKQGKFRI